jgi:hypothetical protein
MQRPQHDDLNQGCAFRKGSTPVAGLTEKYNMVDADDTKLKAEIDEIVTAINNTMKKIERVVPLKPAPSDQPEEEQVDEASSVEKV